MIPLINIVVREPEGVVTLENDIYSYRATFDGDITCTAKRGVQGLWTPVVTTKRRAEIWNACRVGGKRIAWRERNGVDIAVLGFQRMPGIVCSWYCCNSCGALYTDFPDLVSALKEKGCTQRGCTNKRGSDADQS